MAVRRRRRSSLSGFGGGLGQALVQQRARSSKKTMPRPGAGREQLFNPPRVPLAGDINLGGIGELSGGTGSYDLMSDPAVAAAQGLAQKMRAQANAMALAKRKQAAIEYGDPSGVEGIDDSTKKAASENPFSILKNLDRTYQKGVGDLEEGLNQANLHYSGYRGKQLSDASTAQQQARYGAGTSFKGLMSDVNNELANALLSADAMEIQAQMGSGGGYYEEGGDGPNDGDYSQQVNPVGGQRIIRPGLFGKQSITGAPSRPRQQRRRRPFYRPLYESGR